jgi:uncharacterized membrane protein
MTQKYYNHLQNGYDVKISDYFSRGMALMQKNMGNFIGYTVVYILIAIVINFIPFLNIFISALISPCLIFGFYLVAQKVSTGKIPDFNHFFKGFGKLVVINIIVSLLIVVIFLPLIFTMGFSFLGLANDPQALAAAMMGNIAFFMISAVVALFVSVCWVFSSQIAVFHNMEAWQAMEASRKIVMKNWFMMFLFLFIVGLVAVAGILLLCVGLLFTIPLTYCMLYAAFEDIVGLPGGEDDSSQIYSIGDSLKM